MNKSKKLFNSEDFDKKKPLFESGDFDKPVEENQNSKAKIIGGLLIAAVIIAGGIFFANNNKANDNCSNKSATESVAQEKEKHGTDNKYSSTESNGKTEAMASVGAEGKPAANEANPKPYAVDENHVTTSTERYPTSPSEKSENNVDGNVEANARRVIRGDFGNGQERKDKLGSSYSEIQSKVNEMYHQGLVH